MGPAGLVQAGPPADSLRAVLDSVFAGPAYRWVARPNPLAFLLRWWRELRTWLASLQRDQPVVYWLIFWLLVVVLVAIFVHAVWLMVRTIQASGAASREGAGPAAEIRDATWYRKEALRLAATGRYPEAMQADFLGLVLELDQRRLLRFHPSKTPNEYTYEVNLPDAGRVELRRLVRVLYGYAFARLPCGPDDFAAWRAHTSPERYATAG